MSPDTDIVMDDIVTTDIVDTTILLPHGLVAHYTTKAEIAAQKREQARKQRQRDDDKLELDEVER